MTVCILDTTVFCNVLWVPWRDQHKETVEEDLKRFQAENVAFLLPLPVIFETGNHIAHIEDGGRRRRWARIFVEQVHGAFEGEAPWTPTPVTPHREIASWLEGFPDAAMRGLTFADLSIVEIFNKQCALNPAQRVFIWSLDTHLSGHDRPGR
jgi:hypothetical protein